MCPNYDRVTIPTESYSHPVASQDGNSTGKGDRAYVNLGGMYRASKSSVEIVPKMPPAARQKSERSTGVLPEFDEYRLPDLVEMQIHVRRDFEVLSTHTEAEDARKPIH